MQARPTRNRWRLAFFGLAGILLILVLFGGCLAVIGSGVDSGKKVSSSKQTQPTAKSDQKPQGVKKPQPETSQQADATAAVRSAVNDYYANASAGDFSYTYDHLSAASQANFTYDEWFQSNQVGGSAGTTYSPGTITMQSPTAANVQVTIGATGETRNTVFVNEGGQWVHDLTSDEIALFSNNLASASAASSASASAAPSSTVAGSGGNAKVVVSANKPVDVSIISVEDSSVPTVSEETASKTYTFSLQPGADLQVAATDPSTDFNANDNISVKVYVNGQLKAEDSDDVSALVEF